MQAGRKQERLKKRTRREGGGGRGTGEGYKLIWGSTYPFEQSMVHQGALHKQQNNTRELLAHTNVQVRCVRKQPKITHWGVRVGSTGSMSVLCALLFRNKILMFNYLDIYEISFVCPVDFLLKLTYGDIAAGNAWFFGQPGLASWLVDHFWNRELNASKWNVSFPTFACMFLDCDRKLMRSERNQNASDDGTLFLILCLS